MDRSNGYEAVSEEFLERRGSSFTRSTAIGAKEVRKWARTLPRSSSVIDLGCGPGFPITTVLVEEGLQIMATIIGLAIENLRVFPSPSARESPVAVDFPNVRKHSQPQIN